MYKRQGIISLFTHPFVGMCLIGAGLICGGIGLLFLMLTVAMAGTVSYTHLDVYKRQGCLGESTV